MSNRKTIGILIKYVLKAVHLIPHKWGRFLIRSGYLMQLALHTLVSDTTYYSPV
jgi:hypothetical protein